MQTLYSINLTIHTICGVIALITFWAAVVPVKGSKQHKMIGGWYVSMMYTVAITGIVLAISNFLDPVYLRFGNNPPADLDIQDFVSRSKQFALFLILLALLILVGVRHSILSLKAKNNRSLLRRPSHVILVSSLLVAGILTLMMSLSTQKILFGVFAVIAILSSLGTLKYCFKSEVYQREWIIEHLASIFGSGIGMHTAFFSFGARTLFDGIFTGWMILIPWLAPSIIGVVAIGYCSRYYARKLHVGKTRMS